MLPRVDEGFKLTALATGALTVRVAVLVEVPMAAVMTGLALAATGIVVTGNVVDVCPAAIVTEAGTVAAAVTLDVRFTVVPPVGAGPLIVTEPVDPVPPVTAVGLRVTPLTVGASMVTLTVFDWPPGSVPVTVTTVLAATGVVVPV